MLFDSPWEEKKIEISHNEALVLDMVLTMSSYSQDYLERLMNEDLADLRYQACAIFSMGENNNGELLIREATTLKVLLAIVPTTVYIDTDPAGYTLKCKLTKAAQEGPKESNDDIDIEKLMRR